MQGGSNKHNSGIWGHVRKFGQVGLLRFYPTKILSGGSRRGFIVALTDDVENNVSLGCFFKMPTFCSFHFPPRRKILSIETAAKSDVGALTCYQMQISCKIITFTSCCISRVSFQPSAGFEATLAAVEHSSCNLEIVGSDPAKLLGYLLFLSSN